MLLFIFTTHFQKFKELDLSSVKRMNNPSPYSKNIFLEHKKIIELLLREYFD